MNLEEICTDMLGMELYPMQLALLKSYYNELLSEEEQVLLPDPSIVEEMRKLNIRNIPSSSKRLEEFIDNHLNNINKLNGKD